METSATVAQPFSSRSCSLEASSTTLRMSLSLPTPEGSIRMRSGWYVSISSARALEKSPTSVQQMQPEFSSVTWMPESFMKPPSMPTSPYSFSSRTTFSPSKAPPRSFLISVVLPAPRKPEIMLTFVILNHLSSSYFFAIRRLKALNACRIAAAAANPVSAPQKSIAMSATLHTLPAACI